MCVQFITHTALQGQSWRLFKAQGSRGEFLRTTAPASAIRLDPLSVAMEELFLTIIWPGPYFIH
jgi:hypothetical protein